MLHVGQYPFIVCRLEPGVVSPIVGRCLSSMSLGMYLVKMSARLSAVATFLIVMMFLWMRSCM